MQKHPMYSVKEAAEVLGCDERWVREQLNQGQLRGEKRSIGLKEKWYVFKGEIDGALARKGISRSITVDTNAAPINSAKTDFDSDTDTVDAEVRHEIPKTEHTVSVDSIVKAMTDKFAEKLDEVVTANSFLKQEVDRQERIIEEQGIQLRLLPDLQQRAKDAEAEKQAAELRRLEVEALKTQVAAIEAEKSELLDKAKEASELAASLLSLKAKVEELERPWWKKLFSTPSP